MDRPRSSHALNRNFVSPGRYAPIRSLKCDFIEYGQMPDGPQRRLWLRPCPVTCAFTGSRDLRDRRSEVRALSVPVARTCQEFRFTGGFCKFGQ